MPKRKLDDLLRARNSPLQYQAKAITTPGAAADAVPKPTGPNEQAQRDFALNKVTHVRRLAQPVDVSKELASLSHPTKQNKSLPKLPHNVTIAKRPINHGPIASRFAGSEVPKVIYVSRKTPVISAVKRVKQFLREIEKRAMQSAGADGVLNRAAGGHSDDKDMQRKLEIASNKLHQDAEEVLVKASGRAMEQALRVAEWFRTREDEMVCKVDVRTASTSVIDDIVEIEQGDGDIESEEVQDGQTAYQQTQDNAALDGGDTTMELLENLQRDNDGTVIEKGGPGTINVQAGGGAEAEGSKKRRRKRKLAYDRDDIPEARLRWVKTIEVAISLRA